jgi:hypothetical protein
MVIDRKIKTGGFVITIAFENGVLWSQVILLQAHPEIDTGF